MKKILALSLLTLWMAGCKDDDKKETTTPTPVPTEDVVELSTSFGKMYIWLYKETPQHRDNFLKLVKDGFYDGTTFHRLVTDFVIQGGDPNSKDSDPNNDGQGGPGYTIPAEFVTSLTHVRGAIGAARQPDSVNPSRASNGSQFYISMATNASTTSLDGKYTVFGFVMKGMDVADQIVVQPTSGSRPVTDIPMTMKILKKTKSQIKSEYGFDIP